MVKLELFVLYESAYVFYKQYTVKLMRYEVYKLLTVKGFFFRSEVSFPGATIPVRNYPLN